MKVSIHWLKELVDCPVDGKELARLFSLRSAEVESLETLVSGNHLVVGEVLTCEEHPNSDHLHVCTVDIKNQILQIVCGAPNVAQGQKVIVAEVGAVLPGDFAIKKAKIRGVESNGMICSLEELGIDKKFQNIDGIHVLSSQAPVGDNALQYLALDDQVIELDLTPNRADLLSMRGVAHDTAAILDTKVHFNDPVVIEVHDENPTQVFTETKGCKSYYARVVRNVTVNESPDWLKTRLIAAGIRPISNVVDISNYIMLEYGQPLHTFDLDKIQTNRIVVRDALDNEELITLDGKKRILTKEDIVITDGDKPIALGGVMGGLDTEVSRETKNILIESASFDPLRIRKTSKRLDLRSEASIRFERGLDLSRTKLACDRAAVMLGELASGEILKGISYFDTHNLQKNIISLPLKKIKDTTGYDYTTYQIESVLNRLQFKYQLSGETFQIEIPTRRPDIYTYQDIIEEIVRIHGYENIPATIPVTPTSAVLSDKQRMRRSLISLLTTKGFNQTITYTLVSRDKATYFDANPITPVCLYNPMSEDRSVLRHSLLPSLLDVMTYNLSRKQEDIALFELGKTYFTEGEHEHLCGLIVGKYQPSLWQKHSGEVDFYLFKGIIENILESSKIKSATIEKPETDLPKMHPGISAIVKIGQEIVGYFGRLHPEVEFEYDIENAYVFDLNFDMLASNQAKTVAFQPIPKVPSVSRDIAILVDIDVPSHKVMDAIRLAGKKALIQSTVFDVFTSDKVGKDKKSMAIRLVFQDNEKTFSTEEIDAMVQRILTQLEKSVNATLRS